LKQYYKKRQSTNITPDIELEIKDFREIIAELDLKIEEFKDPNAQKPVKENIVSQSIGFTKSSSDAPITNLGVFGVGKPSNNGPITVLNPKLIKFLGY